MNDYRECDYEIALYDDRGLYGYSYYKKKKMLTECSGIIKLIYWEQ